MLRVFLVLDCKILSHSCMYMYIEIVKLINRKIIILMHYSPFKNTKLWLYVWNMAMEKKTQIHRNVANTPWMLISWVKRRWRQFFVFNDRTKLLLILNDDTAKNEYLQLQLGWFIWTLGKLFWAGLVTWGG